MYYGRSRKPRTRKAKIGWTHLVGGQYYDGFSGSVLLVLSRGSLLPIAHSKDPSYPYMNKRANTGYFDSSLELVSKELNHLAATLHVYARGLIFMK